MKKTIAVIAMTALVACGCSHFRRDRNANTGGSYDSTQMNSGSNSSTNSSSTGTSSSSTDSSTSGTSNPSDKTPK